MFMDDRTLAQIAPSGIFFNTGFINCDNPLLSAQQVYVICTPENLVGFDETAVYDPTTTNIDERAPMFTGFVAVLADFNLADVSPVRPIVDVGGRLSTLQHTK